MSQATPTTEYLDEKAMGVDEYLAGSVAHRLRWQGGRSRHRGRGSLVDREHLAKSINRHKSLAFIEVDLCGRKTVARIGLSIVTTKAA